MWLKKKEKDLTEKKIPVGDSRLYRYTLICLSVGRSVSVTPSYFAFSFSLEMNRDLLYVQQPIKVTVLNDISLYLIG